ncbi:hypothetical protein C8R44DRAFT_880555 [Mycena epipterygia]|nr:hypothetical protein C8R44DRAFT_880555 [Mycena epipterygia]
MFVTHDGRTIRHTKHGRAGVIVHREKHIEGFLPVLAALRRRARLARHRRTQLAVNDRLVTLYAWTISMWRMGWRTDGDAALYCITPDPVYTVDAEDNAYVELDADEASVEPIDIVCPGTPMRRPDMPIPQSSVEPEVLRVRCTLGPLHRRERHRQGQGYQAHYLGGEGSQEKQAAEQ